MSESSKDEPTPGPGAAITSALEALEAGGTELADLKGRIAALGARLEGQYKVLSDAGATSIMHITFSAFPSDRRVEGDVLLPRDAAVQELAAEIAQDDRLATMLRLETKALMLIENVDLTRRLVGDSAPARIVCNDLYAALTVARPYAATVGSWVAADGYTCFFPVAGDFLAFRRWLVETLAATCRRCGLACEVSADKFGVTQGSGRDVTRGARVDATYMPSTAKAIKERFSEILDRRVKGLLDAADDIVDINIDAI